MEKQRNSFADGIGNTAPARTEAGPRKVTKLRGSEKNFHCDLSSGLKAGSSAAIPERLAPGGIARLAIEPVEQFESRLIVGRLDRSDDLAAADDRPGLAEQGAVPELGDVGRGGRRPKREGGVPGGRE